MEGVVYSIKDSFYFIFIFKFQELVLFVCVVCV